MAMGDIKGSETGRGQGLQVIFGTGPVGLAVARSLLDRGLRVRLVNRSGKLPAGFPGIGRQVEIAQADARDPAQAVSASSGASHIYHCAHAPYNRWPEILPTLYGNLMAAAREAGAVLGVAQNLYMYARGAAVINEEARVDPPSRKGRIIQGLHEKLQEAGARDGLRWTAVRASDFYGPFATEQSMFGTRFLDPLFAGKRPMLIGNIDRQHSFTYVQDFGGALAAAALTPRAHGRAWIVPNDRPASSREMAELFFAEAGRRARIQVIPRAGIALAGLFDPIVHEILEVLYQKEEPYAVDGSTFEKAFGFQPTPLQQGVRLTLDWYADRREKAAA